MAARITLTAFTMLVAMASTAEAQAPKKTKTELEINIEKAIKLGVEHLWDAQNSDGFWEYGTDKSHYLGMTALAALALHENGVLSTDPRFRKAMRYVRDNCLTNTNTYSVSLATILLARVGQVEDRSLVKTLSARLCAGQYATGGWRYDIPTLNAEQVRDKSLRPKPKTGLGDLSATQFAVVALWQAQRLGFDVENSLENVRKRLAWSQTQDGGWNYEGIPDGADRDTITTAGSFMWVVSSAWEIKRARAKDIEQIVPKKPRPRESASKRPDSPHVDIYDSLARALAEHKQEQQRNNRNFDREASRKGRESLSDESEVQDRLPPVIEAKKPSPLLDDPIFNDAVRRVGYWLDNQIDSKGMYYYYYLWSVERLGVLLGRETFGKTKWFEEGARRLVERQNEDGSWGPTFEESADSQSHYKYGPDTCFALLFLRKANLGSDATKLLNPNSETPFTLAEKPDSKFRTLDEAVAAAPGGSTIVVAGDGPFVFGGLKIDKPLKIRAAQGYDPIFEYSRPKTSVGGFVDPDRDPHARHLLIVTKGPISIEGIHFRMDPPETAKSQFSVIRAEKSDVYLLNCTLSKSNRQTVRGIDLIDSPRSFVRNTMFIGVSPAIDAQSTNQVRLAIRDSVAYTDLFCKASGAGAFEVWLIESTLQARAAFDFAELSAEGAVIAESNILKVDAVFSLLGRTGARTWDGFQNLYEVRNWVADGPAPAVACRNLDQWKQYWQTQETSSKQGAVPFRARRLQIGAYRHGISPQDWTIEESQLISIMATKPDQQIGANVYVVGAGDAYIQYREKLDYDRWLNAQLPSERAQAAGD